MKILFVSHSTVIGGAENMMLELIKASRAQGFECQCLFPGEGPLEREARSIGIKTHTSEIRWFIQNFGKPLLSFHKKLNNRVEKLKKLILDEKIDLVVTNTCVFFEGALAARLAGVPHVWRIAELLSLDPALKSPMALKDLYSLILLLSQKVIVVAEVVKKEIERFVGKTSSKVEVIYDTLSDGAKENSHYYSDKKIVFSAGYICLRKGFHTFLKAAARVHKKMPEASFLVAGKVSEPDYYKNLLKMRRELGLEKTFHFCGFQTDMYSLLNQSNVFVLSSLSEPFGVVLLEAMNAGLPIVTTDSGGPGEAVINGKTGYVVPVDDDKAMADRLIHLLENKEEAEQMGKAGKQRLLEFFSFDQMEKRLASIFQDAVSEYHAADKQSTAALQELLNILSNMEMGIGNFEEMAEFYYRIHDSLLFRFFKKMRCIFKIR